MKRLILGCAIAALLSGFTLAEDYKPSMDRMARLDSFSYRPNEKAVMEQQGDMLTWLEEILTRLPSTDEPTKVAQHTVRRGPVKAPGEGNAQEAPSDPMFPKPAAIPPLYTSPKLDGEGIWTDDGLPKGSDGRPLLYKTVYRPSVEFPNSVVYMAVFDMKRVKPRFFLGNTEPGVYEIQDMGSNEDLSKIVAITNAMWMQQHARGAGAIFRGREVYPMVEGMATLVVFRDDSVDILEWSKEIPRRLVRDARQLRHLIVKNGKVVDEVLKNGKLEEAEIGLGGFLVDDSGRSTMRNKFWFLANRTAFGIRGDGNLVFAMGHHISTKDLAKALVLAGCKSAIHGDANIHNIVCNFYFRNEKDRVVKRDRLSPEQLKYTMKRYDEGYAKDFFAFYEKEPR